MMKKYLIIAVITLALSPVSRSQDFVKAGSGVIDFTPDASRSVNWVDYDIDHDLDLFISIGIQGGGDNKLYRNDNGTFTQVFDQPIVQDNLPSDGASWGDFNNDGNTDACVVNWYNRIALLYQNNGNGNFTFLSSSPVSNLTGYSETCSFGDYDNDGWLDLFITNSAGTNHRNYLYRNNGSGEFMRIDTGIVVSEIGRARGANWIDIDNDRDLDLFVCRESNQNEYLYRNEGNGYFVKITDSPLSTSAGESWSASWGDYDNDGDADVFVTNHNNQNNFLFRNDGGFAFTRITNDVMVNEPGYHSVSGWGDYDNDGDLDMFITQSFIPPAFTQKATNKLFRNMLTETGQAGFVKVTQGSLVTDSGYSYGFAWGDYDNDGDLDVAVANTFSEAQSDALYINEEVNSNHWVKINCKGVQSNASGIGAKVRVKASIGGNPVWQLRHVEGQSGYCGQNLQLHFGLGGAQIIDSIIVEWPSGITQSFTAIQTNKTYTVIENGSITSIGQSAVEEVQDFRLHQNFPNPFNPKTQITFELKNAGTVSLKVYDALGNAVTDPAPEWKSAGSHTYSFDGSGKSSGVYFYKLSMTSADGKYSESTSRKMLLVK